MSRQHRILIVEDDPEWLSLLEFAAGELPDATIETAPSAGVARNLLRARHFRFVSIDQNIPDIPSEVIGAQHGFSLCETVMQNHPLTARAIYTNHGGIGYAHHAALIGQTPYILKRMSDNEPTGSVTGEDRYMDVGDYIKWVGSDPLGKYHLWALEQAGQLLPNHLARYAAGLARGWRGTTPEASAGAVDALGRLLEAAVDLAWGTAMGLLHAAQHKAPQRPTGGMAEKLQALPGLWRTLEEAEMLQPWMKFLGGKKLPGGPFAADTLSALEQLRTLRNDRTHGRLDYPTRQHLDDRLPAILCLLDLLALWTERPLITSPRYHPSERGRIEYIRLAGPGQEKVESTLDLFPPLQSLPGRIYVPWERAGEAILADLFPFLVMVNPDSTRPAPLLLQHWANGKATYASLADGTQHVYAPNRPDGTALRTAVAAALGDG